MNKIEPRDIVCTTRLVSIIGRSEQKEAVKGTHTSMWQSRVRSLSKELIRAIDLYSMIVARQLCRRLACVSESLGCPSGADDSISTRVLMVWTRFFIGTRLNSVQMF